MAASASAGLALPRALRLLAALKWKLTFRHYKRQPVNSIATAVALVILLVFGLIGLGVLFLAVHADPGLRGRAFMWAAWVFSLLWLSAPLSQFDAQRSLDLSALRLAPLPASAFTGAVLLDALISPQASLLLPLLVGAGVALTLSPAEAPIVFVSLLALLACNLALGQAALLSFARLLSSRRFADVSIILGMLFIFGIQGVNVLVQTSGLEETPRWARLLVEQGYGYIEPLLRGLYPGLAAGAVEAASHGQPTRALLLTTALLAQALVCIYLVRRAAASFYGGSDDSAGSERGPKPQTTRLAARRGWLAGAAGAVFNRERLYMLRDPLPKTLFLQALLAMVYLSAVTAFTSLRIGRGEMLAEAGLGKYLLAGMAMVLSFTESGLLFNKLGLDGAPLTHALLSPVDRAALLRGKSAFFLSTFLGLNVLLIAGLSVALRVEPLYAAAALALLLVNSALIDTAGSFVSVHFPFAYRRVGRHFKPLYAQAGCGYMLLYLLVFQLCNLIVLPGSAAIALGAWYGGWPGLAAGTALAAALALAAYRYGLPLAARQLLAREPELLAALSRTVD